MFFIVYSTIAGAQKVNVVGEDGGGHDAGGGDVGDGSRMMNSLEREYIKDDNAATVKTDIWTVNSTIHPATNSSFVSPTP